MNLDHSLAKASSISDGRPNLLIVGAQKAGTTLLATRLAMHGDIYLPPQKEMNFFTNPNWRQEATGYLKHYSRYKDTMYRLDATPGYFWTSRINKSYDNRRKIAHSTEKAIFDFLGPNTRILIILRHPARRAVSAFFHHFRMGRIGSQARIRNLVGFQGIVDIGFYSDHLSNYLKVFPSSSVKIIFLEEYSKDLIGHDLDIYQWLGLDPLQVDTSAMPRDNMNFKTEVSGSSIRLCSGIHQVLALKETDSRFKKMALVDPPIVEERDLQTLNQIYHNEIINMTHLFPKLSSLWPLSLSLSDF
jgi:hypothetical protein